MKKSIIVLAFLILFSFTACSQNNKTNDTSTQTEGKTSIETLKVQFVPSRDPDDIVTQTEPLKDMLKSKLADEGFDVKEVEISVGTSYEATGEALSAGSVDVGFIPGGTYVIYDDGADVILTATRAGLSIDSDNPIDWNKNKPTTKVEDNQVTFYRSILIAGPSEKGQELAAKVNNGEELTWDDLNSAKWAVRGSSSSAGYIYPYLLLQKNYEKGITDLTTAVQADSYGSAMARLASGQVDIVVAYGDARLDYADKWQGEWGSASTIWDETNIIGVTDKIYNDTISVSKSSENMSDELKTALTKIFIDIGNSAEGKEIISIYSHDGYKEAKSEDYDKEREAQELLKNLK